MEVHFVRSIMNYYALVARIPKLCPLLFRETFFHNYTFTYSMDENHEVISKDESPISKVAATP